jgi:hypothetical protein
MTMDGVPVIDTSAAGDTAACSEPGWQIGATCRLPLCGDFNILFSDDTYHRTSL